jgi:hypothetical protein
LIGGSRIKPLSFDCFWAGQILSHPRKNHFSTLKYSSASISVGYGSSTLGENLQAIKIILKRLDLSAKTKYFYRKFRPTRGLT